jgi:hypothetical protein
MADLTAYLLLAAFIILLFYDLWLILTDRTDATISLVVYKGACDYPIIPFLAGVVIGHILWPHFKSK